MHLSDTSSLLHQACQACPPANMSQETGTVHLVPGCAIACSPAWALESSCSPSSWICHTSHHSALEEVSQDQLGGEQCDSRAQARSKHVSNQLPSPFRPYSQTLVAQQGHAGVLTRAGAGHRAQRSMGLALSQVMQRTQLRLSTSCAGCE